MSCAREQLEVPVAAHMLCGWFNAPIPTPNHTISATGLGDITNTLADSQNTTCEQKRQDK